MNNAATKSAANATMILACYESGWRAEEHPVLAAKIDAARRANTKGDAAFVARARETFGAAEFDHIMRFWSHSEIVVVRDDELAPEVVKDDICVNLSVRIAA